MLVFSTERELPGDSESDEEVNDIASQPLDVDPHSSFSSSSQPSASSCQSSASSCQSSASSSLSIIEQCEKGQGKKRKRDAIDPIDMQLMSILQQKRTADKPTESFDEEALFGMQIAARLRTLPPQQKVLAQIRIQEVLMNVQFGFQWESGDRTDGGSAYYHH